MVLALRNPVKRPNRKSHARSREMGTFRAVRACCPPAPAVDRSVIYKVAQTRADREAAFRLTYDAYTASGLIATNPCGMRVTPYHLSPLTGVFLAVLDRVPTYTVSLLEDADLGLPLEALYRDEVNAMRAQGLKLAEVSCLAARCDSLDRKRRFDTYVNLMGLMAQYARRNGVQRLLVAVHPRHAKFYVDFLGFEVFGALRSYESVNGNPAVGCYHDFAASDQTGYRLRDQVYRVKHAPWMLLPQPMPPEEVSYFERATAHTAPGFLPTAA